MMGMGFGVIWGLFLFFFEMKGNDGLWFSAFAAWVVYT